MFCLHFKRGLRWLRNGYVLFGISLLFSESQLTAQEQRVLWYPFTDGESATVVSDASGNGHDGILQGGAVLTSDGAYLDGQGSYIQLPDNILSGLQEITITATIAMERGQSAPYFIYGLGNSSEDVGDGYLFTTGNHYRTAISDCHWTCEQNTSWDGTNLGRGHKQHIAYTLENGVGRLFLNGTLVVENTNITLTPADIGGGMTTANYLGRSLYAADSYFKGYFTDFQIWDGALSEEALASLANEQLAEIVLTDSEAVARDWESLTIHHQDDVRGHLYLPLAGENGSQISWASSNPELISTDGLVSRSPACLEGSTSTTSCGQTYNVELVATIKRGGITRVKTFQTTLPPLPQVEDYAGYLFTYFTGEGYENGEQVYFALSNGNSPVDWQLLNQENPVLNSLFGEMGARDPFIIRSPEGDRFYLIATDLKVYGDWDWGRASTWGSQSILVWESTDLVNWHDGRMIEVSPDVAGNTWAPEAYWDPDRQQYVVFWASKMFDDLGHSNDTYHRMMYSLTRDFINFSEPEVWVDAGYSTIDSTLIEHEGTYYRFTKDERSASTSACGKFILLETSNNLADTSWDFLADCIGQGSINQGEGPLVFKSNTEDKWYLFIDEFGGRGYVPFEADSLASGTWTPVSEYNLPARPRHGTVLPITQAEYDAILQKWGA